MPNTPPQKTGLTGRSHSSHTCPRPRSGGKRESIFLSTTEDAAGQKGTRNSATAVGRASPAVCRMCETTKGTKDTKGNPWTHAETRRRRDSLGCHSRGSGNPFDHRGRRGQNRTRNSATAVGRASPAVCPMCETTKGTACPRESGGSTRREIDRLSQRRGGAEVLRNVLPAEAHEQREGNGTADQRRCTQILTPVIPAQSGNPASDEGQATSDKSETTEDAEGRREHGTRRQR
jgi:hypothetical protein